MTALTDLRQHPYYQTAVDFGLVSEDDQAMALAVQARALAIFKAVTQVKDVPDADKKGVMAYLKDPEHIQNLRNDNPHNVIINNTNYPVSDEVLAAAKADIDHAKSMPDGVPLSGTISTQLSLLTDAQKNPVLAAQAAARAANAIDQGTKATGVLREPFYSDKEPDPALKAAQKLAFDVTQRVNKTIADHPIAADATPDAKTAAIAARTQDMEALKNDPALGSAKIAETFTAAATALHGTPSAEKAIITARDEVANGPLKAAEAAPAQPAATAAAPAATPEKTKLTIHGATVAVAAYQEGLDAFLKKKDPNHKAIADDGAWGKETDTAYREALQQAHVKTTAALGKKMEEAGIHWQQNKDHYVVAPTTPAAPPASREQGHQ